MNRISQPPYLDPERWVSFWQEAGPKTPEGKGLFLVAFAESVLGAEGTELWMILPVSCSAVSLVF